MQNFVVKVYNRVADNDRDSNITLIHSSSRVETFHAKGELSVNIFEGESKHALNFSINENSETFQIIIENANGKTVDRWTKHKVLNTGEQIAIRE